MNRTYLPGKGLSLLIASAIVATFACMGQAIAEETERETSSVQYSSGDRENRVPVVATKDSRTVTVASKPGARGNTKSESTTRSATRNDFWFFDADVILYGDADLDGFYSGIDLLFDADTIYDAVDVYAIAYLSFEGGPWEEYVVTEDFTIFGASGNDSYSVVTDLVSGYPPGSYDLLIELFDAVNGEFLAYIGPEDTSELSFLPLEDIAADTPPGTTTVVVNTEGGGGSADLALLLGLPALVLGLRRLKRRRSSEAGAPGRSQDA